MNLIDSKVLVVYFLVVMRGLQFWLVSYDCIKRRSFSLNNIQNIDRNI